MATADRVPQTEIISRLPSLNYLMSLSECVWEKATELAGPDVAALFQAHNNLEWVIDVMEGRRQPEDPESFLREAVQAIRHSWSLFGQGLPQAIADYLVPDTPVYPDLPSGAVYRC